jgi:hypothetical protein
VAPELTHGTQIKQVRSSFAPPAHRSGQYGDERNRRRREACGTMLRQRTRPLRASPLEGRGQVAESLPRSPSQSGLDQRNNRALSMPSHTQNWPEVCPPDCETAESSPFRSFIVRRSEVAPSAAHLRAVHALLSGHLHFRFAQSPICLRGEREADAPPAATVKRPPAPTRRLQPFGGRVMHEYAAGLEMMQSCGGGTSPRPRAPSMTGDDDHVRLHSAGTAGVRRAHGSGRTGRRRPGRLHRTRLDGPGPPGRAYG